MRAEFLLPYVVEKPLEIPRLSKQISSRACALLSINT
jgi:hypothetical protein